MTDLHQRKEIKTFVQRSSYTNASAFLAAFFDLDSKLQQFYKSLPHEFRANDLMTHTSSERLQRNAYFVRSVYYLCVMYLHSAAVPALSGIKNGLCPSPEIIKLSARKVFSTAREFVELSKEYFSTTPDFTKVPSFVGFCAFVAGSVQEAVMDFQITGEDYDFSGDVAICMVVLKELMVYWPVLKCFVCFQKSVKLRLDDKIWLTYRFRSRSPISSAALNDPTHIFRRFRRRPWKSYFEAHVP